MRKILSIAVLTFFLSTQTSQAFAPIAIPVWYYGAGALAVGGGAGVYCAMKTGYASTIDVAGNLMRKAGVAYIAGSVPSLFEKVVTAKLNGQTVVNAVTSKPTKYVNLKAAMSLVNPVYCPQPSQSSYGVGTVPIPSNFVGKKVMWQENSHSGFVTILSVNGNITYGSGVTPYKGPGLYLYGSSLVYAFASAADKGAGRGWCFLVSYSNTTTPVDSHIVSPPSEIQSKIAPTGTVTDSAYQAELDAMMQDEDYVPTFTDDTTGLPPAYPPLVLTPAQVQAYNAQGVAVDERDLALTAAQQAAASAVAAKDAAVSAANADPTNTALAQKAADAIAAASAATAVAQKVAAENATTAAQEAANEAAKESAAGITIPAVKSFSWARFADLKGSLAATFPFYLIPKIGDLMGQIAPETPTPPVFTLPVYGKTYQISLEMFDPIASALRGFIAVIASIACIIMMVKFYRGTS